MAFQNTARGLGGAMRFEQLESFIQTVETGSFTRAAQELYTTQTNVSKQVAALERELGCKLVDRGFNPVRATEAGEALLPCAVNAVAEMRRGRAGVEACRRAEEAVVRLGTCYLAFDDVTPALIKAFERDGGGRAVLALVEDGGDDLVDAVLRGAVDAAFVGLLSTGNPAGVEVERLYPLTEKALVPADHPLAGRDTLGVRDLAGETLLFPRRMPAPESSAVSAELERVCSGTPVRCVDDAGSIPKMVALGQGVGVVPSLSDDWGPDVRAVPVRTSGRLSVALVWKAGAQKQELFRFVGFARTFFASGPDSSSKATRDRLLPTDV